MQQRIYLDHAATTPMRAAAIEAMTTELTRVGNPSSLHTSGRDARRVLEESREVIAACLGAQPAEVIFTSGATEADNLILLGAVRARRRKTSDDDLVVVTTTVEHHAVLETAESVASDGVRLELLPVNRDGLIDLDQLRMILNRHADRIAVLSVMWANNETGVVQPIEEIAGLARRAGVLVHSDAVQAVGQLPIDFAGSGLDALSLSAHKFGGPVGIGALLARKEIRLAPVQHGGGQERDLRSGTLDVAGVAGAAAAIKISTEALAAESRRLRDLREKLITGALAIDGTVLNGVGDPAASLPGIANVGFAGCQADDLLMLLDQAGIDCSTGSACTAGVSQPSHVLEAMGRTRQQAGSALRFSLGHTTTASDIDRLLAALPATVERARRVLR
ncbi:cysteine desulfurase [Microlunatus elymi]|uniref:cysteine desulfurase n=1 Tax=Microlunatus elymi TaxID=2596828 RepID=A0A516Q0N5_9ACTN|nr:cysteine desulfurase family protein [Microlunatus elymi]QDP96995.1 cysteine desulfurase [Microlunatus elymi]